MQLAKLLKEADAIGDLLRYRHQGFLANKRQLRMGGLAAIELAQMLRTDVSCFSCVSRGQTVPSPLQFPCAATMCMVVIGLVSSGHAKPSESSSMHVM